MIYYCFHYKFQKQPHQIKCSDQFRVNTQDTDCFEHPQDVNTKPSVNVSVLDMLELSYRHQDFYGFYGWEVKSNGTLIEWERDVDVFVAISSLLILVEKSVVKLQKEQSREDIENSIHEE